MPSSVVPVSIAIGLKSCRVLAISFNTGICRQSQLLLPENRYAGTDQAPEVWIETHDAANSGHKEERCHREHIE